MQDIREQIISRLQKVLKEITNQDIVLQLEHAKDGRHGDYSTNIAFTLFANKESGIRNQEWKSPLDLAQKIADQFMIHNSKFMIVSRVEAVPPGFINFWLSKNYLISQLSLILNKTLLRYVHETERSFAGRRIMVEFAHPNTHKEMHIGHMRTLITGEALSRIFEANKAKVFRANYQGDIGPHVAKAIFGIEKLMKERKLSLDDVEKRDNTQKAHFLGEGYVRGSKDYEKQKEEIDGINAVLYSSSEGVQATESRSLLLKIVLDSQAWPDRSNNIAKLYQVTRQWSLDYYDEFYTRFYTKFDKLFFESDMVSCGKDIVLKNIGKIFKKDNGAIIFPGEKYGLHTRVFVTQAGNPTYEGKEMCNAFREFEAFPFDKKIHVVASEQSEYFKVVFKALELIDPKKFKDRQYHISMGMVNLSSGKMSSRTGDVLTVDSLINEVKEKVNSFVEAGKIKKGGEENLAEEVAIGAIKYSVLRVSTNQDVAFDIEKSVSLEGNSGPYLQYTYARTQSVLAKRKGSSVILSKAKDPMESTRDSSPTAQNDKLRLKPEELSILRVIYRFPEVVEEAEEKFAPNLLCNYLFDLSQKFNLFYQKVPILRPVILNEVKNPNRKKEILRSAQDDRVREFRLALTMAVGQIIKNGLYLLGIQAPERM